ncbi:DUF4314 domain-containing protein [Gottfriedia sp. NPDC058432]|uniref:DUF4314 domain-containing protein n=1 Tax=Gottfriedia sp. NPDC058432 TaxID=3346497 RepID=UPI00365BE2C9
MFSKQDIINMTRELFPYGSRLECINMNVPCPIPPGTQGSVKLIDGIGQIHVKWDNGRNSPVVIGQDSFKRV